MHQRVFFFFKSFSFLGGHLWLKAKSRDTGPILSSASLRADCVKSSSLLPSATKSFSSWISLNSGKLDARNVSTICLSRGYIYTCIYIYIYTYIYISTYTYTHTHMYICNIYIWFLDFSDWPFWHGSFTYHLFLLPVSHWQRQWLYKCL